MRGLVMELKLDITQQRVFDYIVENGSITSLEAIEHFGETRISARIFELKKKGIPIETEWLSLQTATAKKDVSKSIFLAKETK